MERYRKDGSAPSHASVNSSCHFTKQPMTFCNAGCKSQRPPSSAHPQWHVIHLAFDPAEHILTTLHSLWKVVPRLGTSSSWSPSFKASPIGPWVQMIPIWRWHPIHLLFWFCFCLFILSYVYVSWSYQVQFVNERANIFSSGKHTEAATSLGNRSCALVFTSSLPLTAPFYLLVSFCCFLTNSASL